MKQSIQDLYRLFIKPQIEVEMDNGSIITVDLILEIIDDIKPNRMLTNQLSSEEKAELLSYSTELHQISKYNFIPIRGLGIFEIYISEINVLDKSEWRYYQKHRSFLEKHVYPSAPSVVESIDYETDQIIKYIPFPENKALFSFRGLVIGHIQSGKTANFTHLIAKLSSIGYKFIVVLSGTTNALRQQTQYRIDRELTGNNTSNSAEPFVKWYTNESGYRQLTNLADLQRSYDGDFSQPIENFDHLIETENRVVIAVIKKLARRSDKFQEFGSVIGKLLLWITQSGNYQNVPIAVIDDEADQASVDNTTEDDEDPSVINHAIRVLLSKFNKSCYVGYTATPFANVFINPNGLTSSGVDDLYPKDLIYSLPKPIGYFGSSEFFRGVDLSPYVVLVPDDEKRLINDAGLEFTDSLYDAVQTFFFATITKKNRNDFSRSGMLIHTDHRNDLQEVVRNKLEQVLLQLVNEAEYNIELFYEKYDTYCLKANEILKASNNQRKIVPQLKSQLHLLLEDFIQELDIRVVNSRGDQLDYYREPLKTLICIGGNLMSRGLTIEGLIVTYYLRSSTNYDTLLQMARWFGYRSSYHELIRIFITKQIYDQFEYMSSVEEDLRAEISRYIEEGATPLDFAPKVRAHLRMIPSSRLGNARKLRSFSRLTAQTHYLSRKLSDLIDNHKLTNSLVEKYFYKFARKDHQIMAKDLPIADLLDFLNEFKMPHASGVGLDVPGILGYLKSQVEKSGLAHFSILISSRKSPFPNARVEKIKDFKWNPVIRSARGSGGWAYIENEIVNIGVISSSGDIPNLEDPTFTQPLLILYSIDVENSNSFKEYDLSSQKIQHQILPGLENNVKGFAIAFPQSINESDRLDYYQQLF
jgi:hypothetical protein